jgi:peroxiredoxin
VARMKTLPVPEIGDEAPEFHLPSAQGGQLRLSMRTARGPVVVVFYSGGWSGEDVAYFKDLASKEDEINLAAGSMVGIGLGEPHEAREFARETGIKSYVLYDYAAVATREYGLLEKDREHGEYARSATFIVDTDHKVVHAWVGERPEAKEVLAKVFEITGLPKPAEKEEAVGEEERPKRKKSAGEAGNGGERGAEAGEGERKKLSPEERERRRAERRAARTSESGNDTEPQTETGDETEAKPTDGE